MAQQTVGTPGGFDAFLGEVRTTLLSVEQVLLHLSSSPGDPQALQKIYHYTSVIGTSAALMSCPTLSQIARNMAGQLANILEGRTTLNASTYALLQGSYVHMQQVVAALASQSRSQEEGREGFKPGGGARVTIIESHLSPQPSFERAQVGRLAEPRHAPSSNTRGERLGALPPEEGTTSLAIVIIGQYQRQRRTGQLWLARGTGRTAEEGTMIFQQGRILDATDERRHGTEARNWISTWEICHYRFIEQMELSADGTETP
jgi:chemotaxis protein histidine kinase CheA